MSSRLAWVEEVRSSSIEFTLTEDKMSQPKKRVIPKVTIIDSNGASQTINFLLEDRDELDWLMAVGRNKNGDIFFYDTGGDILHDLGALEYVKERILRDYFGEMDE
jgi:hypothetical protein